MTRTQKTKIIITAILFITLFGTALFFILKIRFEIKEVRDLNIALYESENEKANIDKLKENFSLMKTDFDSINSSFVLYKNEPYFIEEIENLASSFNVSIKFSSVFVEINDELSDLGLEYLNIKTESKGDFTNLYRLLKSVENLPYHIDIQKSSFIYAESDNKEKDAQNTIRLFLELKVLKKTE